MVCKNFWNQGKKSTVDIVDIFNIVDTVDIDIVVIGHIVDIVNIVDIARVRLGRKKFGPKILLSIFSLNWFFSFFPLAEF